MQPLPPAEPVDARWLAAHPLPELATSDKYGRGTVAIVGGGPQTPGGMLLAGRAALRMGAGRVRIATARTVAVTVAVALPEARVVGLGEDDDGGLVPDEAALEQLLRDARTVLIGPGAASSTMTTMVEMVAGLAGPTCTVVLDAGAIAAVVEPERAVRETLRRRLVLTPNHQELARALGHERDDGPAELAARTGAVVSCFGRIHCHDGSALLVDGDHAGLGTSGSGDVLAGLVAGAASRCPDDPCLAAVWGTFAHADAGHRLLRSRQHGAYLASELIDAVGARWLLSDATG
jgi:ADP-dependent NAD(P)H-hydrate dehydratase